MKKNVLLVMLAGTLFGIFGGSTEASATNSDPLISANSQIVNTISSKTPQARAFNFTVPGTRREYYSPAKGCYTGAKLYRGQVIRVIQTIENGTGTFYKYYNYSGQVRYMWL